MYGTYSVSKSVKPKDFTCINQIVQTENILNDFKNIQ